MLNWSKWKDPFRFLEKKIVSLHSFLEFNYFITETFTIVYICIWTRGMNLLHLLYRNWTRGVMNWWNICRPFWFLEKKDWILMPFSWIYYAYCIDDRNRTRGVLNWWEICNTLLVAWKKIESWCHFLEFTVSVIEIGKEE